MPLARTKETSCEQSVSMMIGSADRSSARDKPSKQAISSASSGSVHETIYLQEEKMIDPPSSLRIVLDPALPSLKEPSTESFTKPTGGLHQGVIGAQRGAGTGSTEATAGCFPFKMISVGKLLTSCMSLK
jgi:hypothetical protein